MKYPKNRKYHGMTKTPIYKVWAQMIYRCHDENHDCYADYGGRGISVCGRWREFSLFFDDMGLPPSRRHSLDRINNNGNYEPTNCRWSLPDEQANNRRNHRMVDYLGTPCTLAQAVRSAGGLVTPAAAYTRLMHGWPMPEAVEMPSHRGKQPKHYRFPSDDLGFPRGVP